MPVAPLGEHTPPALALELTALELLLELLLVAPPLLAAPPALGPPP
jgi:hypothetical protein